MSTWQNDIFPPPQKKHYSLWIIPDWMLQAPWMSQFFSLYFFFISGLLIWHNARKASNDAPFCVSSAADTFSVEPATAWTHKLCNETRLQWDVEVCGDEFKHNMEHIDSQHWCNLTSFIKYALLNVCFGCKKKEKEKKKPKLITCMRFVFSSFRV